MLLESHVFVFLRGVFVGSVVIGFVLLSLLWFLFDKIAVALILVILMDKIPRDAKIESAKQHIIHFYHSRPHVHMNRQKLKLNSASRSADGWSFGCRSVRHTLAK
uniref:Uncharacterized protein n=1 Tax=Ditylum brightwellii TaxID=49249 RepID=A0A6U3U4E8_9STRA|mmetsp:Transcript_40466/g.60692  ORF Transcript_40466/g.60692 Transcript_40466/m.60692 type:complete len:105 (+) Transcript_40466:426-740(+)